ncbi:MAG: NFACT RNA binding domain-containing protein [Sphaerochaetaceae bacterium]
MSLNWREIALITAELPLEGSIIQRVHQIGFHALVLELHHPSAGPWELFAEVGTPEARLHRISGPARQKRKQKTEKLQRFIQFLRAHVEGGRVTAVWQPAQDRMLVLRLAVRGNTLHMIFRFYSGPGANIIVCDDSMVIMELLFRRPARSESSGNVLVLPEAGLQADDGRFAVREHPEDVPFNRFIEAIHEKPQQQQPDLRSLLEQSHREELHRMTLELEQARMRVTKVSGFDTYRIYGDLLSANRHLIKGRSEWIGLQDFTNSEGGNVTIALDPSLDPAQNIESYYRKYRKGKTAWEHAEAEVAQIERLMQDTKTAHASRLAVAESGTDAEKQALERSLRPQAGPAMASRDPYRDAPGLRFTSGQFVLLVGRNAKENDELLRRWARGNDWWMHTRDVPGGYVFIKQIAGKTIPLETLLDAANLALLFSKAKDAGKADLYYTQVKHLKRPKGGKAGLVLPTQEKNIAVQLDEGRVQRLFSSQREP